MTRTIVGLILTLLLVLTGCTGGSKAEPSLLPTTSPSGEWSPEVGNARNPGWPADYGGPINWDKYQKGYKQQIDTAAKSKDCATLDRLFAEALDVEGANEEILTYIQRWGQHVDCPNFPEEGEPDPRAAPTPA